MTFTMYFNYVYSFITEPQVLLGYGGPALNSKGHNEGAAWQLENYVKVHPSSNKIYMQQS